MLRASITCLLIALGAASANALPPPPPPPEEQAQIDAFFAALPRQLPAGDLAAFEPLVAPDVEVWRAGELIHKSREAWFAELALNPLAEWKSRNPPVGVAIGRDDFYREQDGDIVVRELVTGVAPEGEFVLYHLGFNLRFVTYTLENGVLVKVDYGEGMDPMRDPASYRMD